MSLVFCGNPVKLYPDVDRRFTATLTPSLCIYLSIKMVVSSKIKSAVDRGCFSIRVSDDHEKELQLFTYAVCPIIQIKI